MSLSDLIINSFCFFSYHLPIGFLDRSSTGTFFFFWENKIFCQSDGVTRTLVKKLQDRKGLHVQIGLRIKHRPEHTKHMLYH